MPDSESGPWESHPAGYSAGSVEKYHYTLSLSWPYL